MRSFYSYILNTHNFKAFIILIEQKFQTIPPATLILSQAVRPSKLISHPNVLPHKLSPSKTARNSSQEILRQDTCCHE